MKKSVSLLLLLSMLITGCSNQNFSALQNDYNSLLSEYNNMSSQLDELEDENSQLNSLLIQKMEEEAELIEEINSLKELLTSQYDLLTTEISEIKAQYNSLLSILNSMSAYNEFLTEELSLLKAELKEVKTVFTRFLIENYIKESAFSTAFLSFFLEQTEPMIEAGMTFYDIIDEFYNQNTIGRLEAHNEDLSLNSMINLSKPSRVGFDKIDLTIYHRDEVLETLTLTGDQSFDLEFIAPHYGKFHLKTKTYYGTLIIEEIFSFGVTSNEYNFATLNATLPVLLYTIDHVAEHTDVPSFIYLGRPTTYKWDFLPTNTYRFPSFIDIGSGDHAWYPMIDNLSKWTRDLFEMNPNSHFNFNVVDNHIGLAMVALDRYSIPEEAYTINIWTDGTFTDTALNSYSSMSVLNSRVDYLNSFRSSLKDIATEKITYYTIRGNVERHAFAYSLKDNVNYYVTSLNGISTLPNEIQQLMTANITVKTVSQMFDVLRASNKMNEFEYLLGTRWGDAPEEGLSTHFNSEKGKYILILGTSTAGETPNSTNKYYSFNDYIDLVYSSYGDEYEILYKGHPAYPSNEERKTLFGEKNIVELRNTIPVEIMMYIYPNVYVGGYRSTAFISSFQDQTLFFFGTQQFIEGQATLKDMIQNTTIFANTSYLYNASL